MNPLVQLLLFALAVLLTVGVALTARRMTRPIDAATLAAEQLKEAQRERLLHLAHAENHQAQADMLGKRIERLSCHD